MPASARSANPRSMTGVVAGAPLGRSGSMGSSKRSSIRLPSSLSVVKDHTERMSPPGAQPAYAMPQVHAIGAARALHGPVMYGEHYPISLAKVNDPPTRLAARPVVGEPQLAGR